MTTAVAAAWFGTPRSRVRDRFTHEVNMLGRKVMARALA